MDNEEKELGTRCIAAPVFDSSGNIIAGISVSGPVTRMSRTGTATTAKAVKRSALQISQYLGYSETGTSHTNLRSGSANFAVYHLL